MIKYTKLFLFAPLILGALSAPRARGDFVDCPKPFLRAAAATLGRAGQSAADKILAGNAMNELGDRLARLTSCPNEVWPRNKIAATKLRVIDRENKSVFEFDPAQKKLNFLRTMNAEDERTQMYSFQNPPEGDGGTTLNLDHFKPHAHPPRDPAREEENKKRACYAENIQLKNFLDENTSPPKATQVEFALNLLTHETFHNTNQNPKHPVHEHTGACQWQVGDLQRNVSGDVKAITFIRQNTIAYLKKAFAAAPGSKEKLAALAQAKAWTEKLRREHPLAAKELTTVDRGEGSAEYAGAMSNVIGKLGCNPDPDSAKEMLLSRLGDRYQPLPLPVDSQAYLLGGAAGFLLDEMKVPGWKEQVEKGQTPLDLLLSAGPLRNLPQVAARADPVLEKSARISSDIQACMQDTTTKKIEAVVQNPGDYVMVQVEEVSVTVSGFFPVKTPDGPFTASPQAASVGEHFRFRSAALVESPGLCGGRQSKFVLVPRSAVANDGKVKEFQQDFTNFEGFVPPPSSSTKRWNGVPVLCRS